MKLYLLLMVSSKSFFNIGNFWRADGKSFDLQCCQSTQITHCLNVLCSNELPQTSGAEAGEKEKWVIMQEFVCSLPGGVEQKKSYMNASSHAPKCRKTKIAPGCKLFIVLQKRQLELFQNS